MPARVISLPEQAAQYGLYYRASANERQQTRVVSSRWGRVSPPRKIIAPPAAVGQAHNPLRSDAVARM